MTRLASSIREGSKVVKYGLPEFEKLETSTSTVMIYTNINFNRPEIFNNLKITKISVPLTKKQKNVDKKKISAPYGSIISVQSKTHIRGVDIRKKKKHWCGVCRPTKIEGEKEVKIFTVTEFLLKNTENDISNIMYDCSRCQRTYKPEDMKKINHFLNQITIVISIGKNPLLNVMLFKDNVKIAGCKDEEDAAEVMLVLWQDFIAKIPGSWELKPLETQPKFIFDVVMRNVDFKLGFFIDRENLNILMNDLKYSDKIFMSQYETTNHTNVNIKMFSRRPENLVYDCLIIPKNTKKEPYFTTVPDNVYKTKKKKEKEKYITFIVFSSSEIILSGRYNKVMKEMYEFFIETVFNNKKKIEENINPINQKEINRLIKSFF